LASLDAVGLALSFPAPPASRADLSAVVLDVRYPRCSRSRRCCDVLWPDGCLLRRLRRRPAAGRWAWPAEIRGHGM